MRAEVVRRGGHEHPVDVEAAFGRQADPVAGVVQPFDRQVDAHRRATRPHVDDAWAGTRDAVAPQRMAAREGIHLADQ